MSAEPIQLWLFGDAPPAYKALSTNGGDEDFVAFVPDGVHDLWCAYLERISPSWEIFGVLGGTVFIGSHA